MKQLQLVLGALLLLGASCKTYNPVAAFDPTDIPPAPDYARLDNWAAHPDKRDPADSLPCPNLVNREMSSAVDVFFLYPTSMTGDFKTDSHWNAAMDDPKINKKTDGAAILFQASIFNGAGKIYAPRYRQAHYESFFTKDTASADKALEVAYADALAAFQYYLEHWNHGRPFIIASHSQGARHAMHLIRDVIEPSDALSRQLVVAYIAGWPVPAGFFRKTRPCTNPEETGCFCTWRTWEREFGKKTLAKMQNKDNVVCTNPLSWTIAEGAYAPATANKGGVVRPFCAIYPNFTDAETQKGFLLSSKPHFPGSRLIRTHNYHAGDFNLFYMNVRENAELRTTIYLQQHK